MSHTRIMDATFDTAVAFLSYAHADDDADEGRIRRLAAKIQNEYQFLTAQRLEIFIDRSDIRWGQQWKERVDGALQSTTFFIPVLTNSFFASDECRREFLEFYNTTTSLGVAQWLLAIRYGPVADLRPASKDPIKAIAASTQYKSWEELRLVDENSAEHRSAVNDMAKELKHLMELVATTPGDVSTVRPTEPGGIEPSSEYADAAALTNSGPAPCVGASSSGQVAPSADLSGQVGAPDQGGGLTPEDVDDPYGDEPSDIELVAEFAPRAAEWTQLMGEFKELMADFTEPISRNSLKIAEADAAGKPFAHRLLILRETAAEIDEPSIRVEDFGQRYMSAVLTLDSSVRATVRLAQRQTSTNDDDRSALQVAKDSLNELASVGRNSAESVRTSIAKGRELARMSRDLRPAIKRYETGCQSILDAQVLIDEWATAMGAVTFDGDPKNPNETR
jgi:hypothetical protein